MVLLIGLAFQFCSKLVFLGLRRVKKGIKLLWRGVSENQGCTNTVECVIVPLFFARHLVRCPGGGLKQRFTLLYEHSSADPPDKTVVCQSNITALYRDTAILRPPYRGIPPYSDRLLPGYRFTQTALYRDTALPRPPCRGTPTEEHGSR